MEVEVELVLSIEIETIAPNCKWNDDLNWCLEQNLTSAPRWTTAASTVASTRSAATNVNAASDSSCTRTESDAKVGTREKTFLFSVASLSKNLCSKEFFLHPIDQMLAVAYSTHRTVPSPVRRSRTCTPATSTASGRFSLCPNTESHWTLLILIWKGTT